MKKTHDYDNVFKTMKMKHKRLFISVINDIFNRSYPTDVKMEVLPSEGYSLVFSMVSEKYSYKNFVPITYVMGTFR